MRGFRVFVGCIPGNTVASELLELFNKYVPVESVSLALDTNSDLTEFCLGYGFAICSSEEAMRALLDLSGTVTYRNRTITLREYKIGAKLKEDKNKFNQRRLFIGNIASCVQVDTLLDLFSKFGTIENLYLVDHTLNQPFKYGYVIFNNESSASMALLEMNNFHLKGHRLRIEQFIGKKETNPLKFRSQKLSRTRYELPCTNPTRVLNQRKENRTIISRRRETPLSKEPMTNKKQTYIATNYMPYQQLENDHDCLTTCMQLDTLPSLQRTTAGSLEFGGSQDSFANPRATPAAAVLDPFEYSCNRGTSFKTQDATKTSAKQLLLGCQELNLIHKNHSADNVTFNRKRLSSY